MTARSVPALGIDPADWGAVLDGHNVEQLAAARVYPLDP